MANGAARRPRAGVYQPVRYRPELVDQARDAGIQLQQMKARHSQGIDYISGFAPDGDLQLWYRSRRGRWERIG